MAADREQHAPPPEAAPQDAATAPYAPLQPNEPILKALFDEMANGRKLLTELLDEAGIRYLDFKVFMKTKASEDLRQLARFASEGAGMYCSDEAERVTKKMVEAAASDPNFTAAVQMAYLTRIKHLNHRAEHLDAEVWDLTTRARVETAAQGNGQDDTVVVLPVAAGFFVREEKPPAAEPVPAE